MLLEVLQKFLTPPPFQVVFQTPTTLWVVKVILLQTDWSWMPLISVSVSVLQVLKPQPRSVVLRQLHKKGGGGVGERLAVYSVSSPLCYTTCPGCHPRLCVSVSLL